MFIHFENSNRISCVTQSKSLLLPFLGFWSHCIRAHDIYNSYYVRQINQSYINKASQKYIRKIKKNKLYGNKYKSSIEHFLGWRKIHRKHLNFLSRSNKNMNGLESRSYNGRIIRPMILLAQLSEYRRNTWF